MILFSRVKIQIILSTIGFFYLISCGSVDTESHIEIDGIGIHEIEKWPNGFQAAYTPTFDTGFPPQYEVENNWLIENGLFLDYEIVSATYEDSPVRINFLMEMTEYGFGYFGHGHTHVNHDVKSFDDAFKSFKKNYDFIEEIGLHPISYAYPGGSGLDTDTQLALKNSGFLSGRLFQPKYKNYGPYIVPGDESEPPNWFALPSLRMEDYDFNQCSECVNNPDEFIPILDENIKLGAWLISTYHAIGYDGDTRPVAWGFYRRNNFFEEMQYVKKLWEDGILWLATMNDVTLHIRQRNETVYSIERTGERNFSLYLNHDLDSELYNMPLTLRFEAEPEFLGHRIIFTSYDDQILYDEIIEEPEFQVTLRPSDEKYIINITEVE